MDNEIKSIVERHDKGIEISGQELSEFLDTKYEVERHYGENMRWCRYNEVIFKFGDRYFSWEYEEGLTEMQDNNFPDSILTEVKPVKKVIEITEWEVI